VYRRDVRASSGYLSGDPARLHFGFPRSTHLEKLEVRWPDGETTLIDDPTPNVHIIMNRF
jgi:hypothetical protein